MAVGSWSLVEELFASGSERFVAEIRQCHFADRLGSFASQWLGDPRPFARQTVEEYLAQPLNCYRHEPLVKRLFKLAEKAGDDQLMGAFLVSFDRLIRRQRRRRNRYKHGSFPTQAEADAAARQWEAEGYQRAGGGSGGGRFSIYHYKVEEAIVAPSNTVMPRPAERDWRKNISINDYVRQRMEKKFLLFSMPTRRYLRRRAWRYFRILGKSDPDRYIRAAVEFLSRYTDADTDSDIHLLDNWGLAHALFRYSPALVCPASGWEFAPGETLADLAPAPRFESAWVERPESVLEVLLRAKCRAVRQWALLMLRKHHWSWLAARPAASSVRLADHDDPDVSALGFDLLEQAPDLEAVPVDAWLMRLGGDSLDKLQRLSDLLARRLDPTRIATDDVLRLASNRSKPVAELGLSLLRRRTFTSADVPVLLPLVQADCPAVRPALLEWLRDTLNGLGDLSPQWILEYLDSKHADVRAIGWQWLHASPLKEDASIWLRLIESPYDDVRGPLIETLAKWECSADPDAIRLLWASVLLNVARGGRYKPGVVARVVDRLGSHPGEAEQLVPLLAVAVRSLRGPEFRAGLAGVVRLVETRQELLPTIRQRFPELVM